MKGYSSPVELFGYSESDVFLESVSHCEVPRIFGCTAAVCLIETSPRQQAQNRRCYEEELNTL